MCHTIIWSFLGAFHMFYKYATDIAHITESGRKKNKQARTWISPKRKKGEVFWHFSGIYASIAIASLYPSEFPLQLPGTLTLPLTLADPLSGSTSTNSFFSSCLSLTVAFPRLLVALLCSLLWDLTFLRLLLVS